MNKYSAFQTDTEPRVIYQHGLYPAPFMEHVSGVEIDGYRFETPAKRQELEGIIRSIVNGCCYRCMLFDDCDLMKRLEELEVI